MSRRVRLKAAQRRCYDLAPRRPIFILAILFLVSMLLLPQIYMLYYSTDEKNCRRGCCANIGSVCLPCEPFDVVYTWVNGTDPILLESMKTYSEKEGIYSEEDLLTSRFDDKQELKYSLRSLEKYAPWVRNIFLVTAGQIPSWLNIHNNWNSNEESRLIVISHEDIIPSEFLPTFSSPAIECFLHKIPGLSERFLYINDDIFLGAPVYLTDFYSPTDGYEVYTAWSVPDCAQGCPWSFLGDSSCDQACNNVACDYDGGDCLGNPISKNANVGNHLEYLGDYADNPFFDEDDKADYGENENIGRYPGLEEKADAKLLQARQVEDGQLLQQLIIQGTGNKHKDPNRKGRKLQSYNSRHLMSVDVPNITVSSPQSQKLEINHKFSIKDGRSVIKINKKKSVPYTSKKKNAIKDILKKANNNTNITNIVHNFNNNIINENKSTKKKKNVDSMFNEREAQHQYSDLRKLDTYAKSLIHTNKIFNKIYGFQNRKVPAHVPFLMEKKTIEKMHEKFSEFIEVTKKNKFRRPNDFQFAFAYYHYLMSEREEYTIEEIFDVYDTDKSGTWSDREVRTVLARVRGPPLTAEAVHALETAAKACDSEEHRMHPTPPNERYMDSDMPTLTKKLIVNCPGLRGPLRGALGLRKSRAFPRTSTTRTTFAMVSSNITKAVTALDEIRRDTKKFICINDNLDASREAENEIVRMVLQELYDALLPIQSQWELPSHVANRFLRLPDLNEWQNSRLMASHILAVCAVMLVILTLYQTNILNVFFSKINKHS